MGQRSLLNAGSNPAGLNGYSPLELLKESSMATLQREASRMGGGMISDPNMQDRFSFSLMAPPPSREDMMMGGEQIMGMMPMAGITAFHGSPHKFSKFDMSKIGTGEGAQAYGHGLYMAENPKVAKGYRDALSDGGVVLNQSLDDTREEVIKRIAKEREYFDSPDYANAIPDPIVEKRRWMLTDAQNKSNNAKDGLNLHGYGGEKFKALEAQGVDLKDLYDVRDGYLYKVDIPDDQIAKMLDWDKPFTEQPKLVQEKLRELIPERYLDDMSDQYNMNLTLEDMTGEELYNTLKRAGADDYTPHLAEEYTRALRDDERASMTLNKLGIPGIKYYDQASRHQAGNTYTSGELTKVRGRWQGIVNSSDGGFETVFGDTKEATRLAQEAMIKARRPTRNFVAFDDQLPTIESINDQPIGLIHGR